MRDKTHQEQIERWAIYVRENPQEWKKKLKPFINSQFQMSREFYERLLLTKGGKEKLERIRNLN